MIVDPADPIYRRTDLVRCLDALARAVADVANYPPPQSPLPDSPAAALDRMLPAGVDLFLKGRVMTYSRVHRVVGLTRLTARLIENMPFSDTTADLARNALDVGLRNEWIYRAPSTDLMLARMGREFSESLEMPALRAQFVSEFTSTKVDPGPDGNDAEWLRNQLKLLAIPTQENASGTRWISIGGEPTRLPVSGSNGIAGIAGVAGNAMAARYRYLSGYSHGLASQTVGRLKIDELGPAASRGKVPFDIDPVVLGAIIGSFADSCELVARGLYRQLGWALGAIEQAARDLRQRAGTELSPG